MTDRSRRRPWLAALLALVVSGLGHAYLRRWARAFGWYVVVTATVVFFVPDAAVERLLAGDPPPAVDVAPALVAVAASVIDAYLVAVRQNRERDRSPAQAATAAVDSDSVDAAGSTAPDEVVDANTVACPHCGRKTDATFDFCQWCAEPVPE